jgi:hypothetical protein
LLPVPLVTALVGLTAPQAAPLVVKSTVSPFRPPPPVAVTVAVTLEVLTPLAGMLAKLAATAIEAAPADVCVTVALLPVVLLASFALIVQKPFVVEAV